MRFDIRFIARVLLVTLLIGWCESGAGRIRAVRAWLPRPSRILVVIAHPDDEILLAPYLAQKCVRGGVSCSILVLTRGENGGDPDVRTGEMARSAALLNARLTQWSLPDSTAPWPERQSLVRQIGDVIATEKPEMILTFDPAHGTTGHPAHRETGSLVQATGARGIYMLETLAHIDGDRITLSTADPRAWTIDTGSDWDYVVRGAEIHASQFTPGQVESLRTLPPEQRKVWLRSWSLPPPRESSNVPPFR